MGARSEGTAGKGGLQAAICRFPTRGPQIEALLARDENFRCICDDLAAAEEALAAVEHLPESLRAVRRLEYDEIVTDLAGEIAEALERANVVTMPRLPKH
ncbi:hypothetical protein [Sinorhizobium alkalisoli]|uniref:hypothetical protein n=1 Tax=Sinorhizobium alkalisoli TaxID=1752398 RepID=UPI00124D9230|nr:hypothetical protein [Sinorhizobium alkalisoli]QFI69068.1 hypothetical protein EKH55_4194 [Sinorhizobium alkalisoli]